MILRPRGARVDTPPKADRAELVKPFDPDEVQQRIEKLLKKDQIRLSALFTDDDVHRLCEELEIDFRERTFTPATTLGLFVSQVLSRGDACSTIMTQFNRERKRQGLSPVSEDASAYCKARARLPVELIDRLSRRVVTILQEKTCNLWKWRSRNVYLVDGLVLRAPDTEANQAVYPQPSSQQPGLGFPQVRAIVTTSLATGCIVHYNHGPVEGKRTGEVNLFREKHGDFGAGDIVLGDANFESFHDAVLLNRQGADLVFCINGTRALPFEGECQRIEDKIVTVPKPRFNPARFTREQWNELPESILYRMIRYRVSGRKEVITIVTTLLDRKRYSAKAIAELYGMRWDVELDICAWKSTIGISRSAHRRLNISDFLGRLPLGAIVGQGQAEQLEDLAMDRRQLGREHLEFVAAAWDDGVAGDGFKHIEQLPCCRPSTGTPFRIERQ